VQLPKKSNRDWKAAGAVKWVDLCLHTAECDQWCWFEFKVRHVGRHDQPQEAAKQARDAFRKDVVALMGFDAATTADTWRHPDKYTKAYWFEKQLEPSGLPTARHHFVAAFLQLGGTLDKVWDEAPLREAIGDWFSVRRGEAGRKGDAPEFQYSAWRLRGAQPLVVCKWSLPPQASS